MSVQVQDLGVFSKYKGSITQAWAIPRERKVVGKYTLLSHSQDPVLDLKAKHKRMFFAISQEGAISRVSIASLNSNGSWQTKQEIDIHSRLEKIDGVCHPRLIEKGTLNYYMISDLCNEDNLLEFLNSHENWLSHWQKDWLCYSIALTLMQCHEARVILRDFKPENILVHKEAEGIFKTEFTDFGMAVYDPEVTDSERRRSCGTLPYLAPEWLMNISEGKLIPPVDFSSDLWALGVVSHAIQLGELYWKDKEIDLFAKNKTMPPTRDCSVIDFGPFSAEIKELLNLQASLRPPAAWIAKRMADIFLRTYPNSPVTERVRNRPKLTLDQVVDILRVVNTKLGGAIASKIASYLPSTAIGIENPKLTLDHVLFRLQELKEKK